MIRFLRLAAALPAALVLAAMPARAAFVDNGDGTVTDTNTGLVWDQCSWGQSGAGCAGGAVQTATRQEALGVAVTANGTNYKSRTDWRLPNVTELQSLANMSVASPALDTAAFPNTPVGWYWSSTSHAGTPTQAWFVGSELGSVQANPKANANLVRLVRAGTAPAGFDRLAAVLSPVLSGVGVSNITQTGMTLTATSNVAATGHWIVVPRGAAAPSPDQVLARVDYPGGTVLAGGLGSMAASSPRSFLVSSLLAGTPFDLYLVADDGNDNLSAPYPVQFATLVAGGPGGGVTSVPTLGEWGLLVLSLLLAGLGVRKIPGRPMHHRTHQPTQGVEP